MKIYFDGDCGAGTCHLNTELNVESATLEKIVKDNGFRWSDYGDFADLLEKGIKTYDTGGIEIYTSVSKIIISLIENALKWGKYVEELKIRALNCKDEIEKNSQIIDAEVTVDAETKNECSEDGSFTYESLHLKIGTGWYSYFSEGPGCYTPYLNISKFKEEKYENNELFNDVQNYVDVFISQHINIDIKEGIESEKKVNIFGEYSGDNCLLIAYRNNDFKKCWKLSADAAVAIPDDMPHITLCGGFTFAFSESYKSFELSDIDASYLEEWEEFLSYEEDYDEDEYEDQLYRLKDSGIVRMIISAPDESYAKEFALHNSILFIPSDDKEPSQSVIKHNEKLLKDYGHSILDTAVKFASNIVFLTKYDLLDREQTDYLLNKTDNVDIKSILHEYNKRFLENNTSHSNLEFTKNYESNVKADFSGKIFVISGKLKNYTSDSFKANVEKQNGTVTTKVSSKTSYVVTNHPDAGTANLRKAAEIGIPIISEEEFLKML